MEENHGCGCMQRCRRNVFLRLSFWLTIHLTQGPFVSILFGFFFMCQLPGAYPSSRRMRLECDPISGLPSPLSPIAVPRPISPRGRRQCAGCRFEPEWLAHPPPWPASIRPPLVPVEGSTPAKASGTSTATESAWRGNVPPFPPPLRRRHQERLVTTTVDTRGLEHNNRETCHPSL